MSVVYRHRIIVRIAGIEQAKKALWDLVKHWKSDENAELVLKCEDVDLKIMLFMNIGK